MDSSLIEKWKQEEKQPFTGWDFAHLNGRWTQGKPTWSYDDLARDLLRTAGSVLDLGTGGGERFARLRDVFPPRVAATEGYRPNVAVAKKRLEPLGVEVVFAETKLPFPDSSFEVLLDRHTAFDAAEVARVLKPRGVFLTQQVDGSLADLASEFGGTPPFPDVTLANLVEQLVAAGLEIERREDWRGETSFADVGALVYYLRAVPWTVPDFSVDRFQTQLGNLQARLARERRLAFGQGAFLIRARKMA